MKDMVKYRRERKERYALLKDEIMNRLQSELLLIKDETSKFIRVGKYNVLVDKDFEYDGSLQVRYKLGYVEVNVLKMIKGKVTIKALSRYIMGTTDVSIMVDHENRNTFDNRWANLRECTRFQNALNTKGRKKIGDYKGLSSKNGKNLTTVSLQHNYQRRQINVSQNNIKKLFAIVYDCMAIKFGGEFANTNFDKSEYNSGIVDFICSKIEEFITIEKRVPRKNK